MKLETLDEDNDVRRTLAARMSRGLGAAGVVLPAVPDWAEPVWHQYVVRHPARDEAMRRLQAAGIEALIHYPVPPHLQPAYANTPLGRLRLPLSEEIHREIFSLPLNPSMGEADIDRIVRALSG